MRSSGGSSRAAAGRSCCPASTPPFTGPLTRQHRLRAGLLHAGAGAMLTGATATTLWDLRYAPDPGPLVHVLVPHGRRVRTTGFVRVRRCADPPDPWPARGLLVAPIPIAVLEPVRSVRSWRDVRAALCEPVQHGWCEPADLVAALERGERAGSALARRALVDVLAGCRSAPECDLRDVVRASRVLPEPRWNTALAGVRPPLVPDAWWPEARLVVEVDSVEWHRLGDAPEATERRRAGYAALGLRVLPVSPRRLRTEPAPVRLQLEAAYRAGLQRP